MTGDTHVTAIMVTGRDEARLKLARNAVTAWTRQRLTRHRQLLVVNDHPTLSLFDTTYPVPDTGIREVRVTEQLTLGDLRNIGIDAADTEYLVQWDDDDISHPSRLLWQLEHTQRGEASIFRYEVHCHAMNGETFVNDGKTIRCGGFPGTMLWPRDATCRFQAIGKREDTEFVLVLREAVGVVVLANDPTFYVRFWHGANTWPEGHVMHKKRGWRGLTESEQSYMQVLRQQYRVEAD